MPVSLTGHEHPYLFVRMKLKKFLYSLLNEQIALSYVKKDANCIQGQTIAIECAAPAVYVANVFHQGQQVRGSCVESATLTWPLMATEPSVLRRKCSHLISSYPSALCFVLVVVGLQEFLLCSPFNQVWVKNCNKQSGFYFCLQVFHYILLLQLHSNWGTLHFSTKHLWFLLATKHKLETRGAPPDTIMGFKLKWAKPWILGHIFQFVVSDYELPGQSNDPNL